MRTGSCYQVRLSSFDIERGPVIFWGKRGENGKMLALRFWQNSEGAVRVLKDLVRNQGKEVCQTTGQPDDRVSMRSCNPNGSGSTENI